MREDSDRLELRLQGVNASLYAASAAAAVGRHHQPTSVGSGATPTTPQNYYGEGVPSPGGRITADHSPRTPGSGFPSSYRRGGGGGGGVYSPVVYENGGGASSSYGEEQHRAELRKMQEKRERARKQMERRREQENLERDRVQDNRIPDSKKAPQVGEIKSFPFYCSN